TPAGVASGRGGGVAAASVVGAAASVVGVVVAVAASVVEGGAGRAEGLGTRSPPSLGKDTCLGLWKAYQRAATAGTTNAIPPAISAIGGRRPPGRPSPICGAQPSSREPASSGASGPSCALGLSSTSSAARSSLLGRDAAGRDGGSDRGRTGALGG